MRGRHRRARNGVGGAVAADPRGQDVGAGREDIEHAAIVGEGRTRPVRLNGTNGDGRRLGRGRVVGRIGVVVTGRHDGQNARIVTGAHDAVEGRGVATAEGRADDRSARPPLGGDVVECPVETVDDDGSGAGRAGKHLHRDDVGLLRDTVGLSCNGTGHVGTVAHRVCVAAAYGVVAEASTALELIVCAEDTGVDDVGVATLAGG